MTGPDVVAIWAAFDQDIAAGDAALTAFVDGLADALDEGVDPEVLLARLIIALADRGHDTVTALAGLAMVRLAKQAAGYAGH